MRFLTALAVFSCVSFAQNLTEFGAAAAVGSVGGAGGKGISDGMTSIFGKLSGQTAKAAGTAEKTEKAAAEPALELAPGVVREETGGVPLPPPPAGKRGPAQPSLPVIASVTLPEEVAELSSLTVAAPVLPPPPEMTADGLKTLPKGLTRADLLRKGFPAAKITMWEDGHLSETYSYRQQGRRIGSVHLTDGAVARVDLQ